MNTTDTFNRDQGRLMGTLAPITKDCIDFDTVEEIVAVLDSLPGYTEFVFEYWDGKAYEFKLMARDMPQPGRRYTNLTTGFEWMGLMGIIENTNPDAIAVSLDGRQVAAWNDFR